MHDSKQKPDRLAVLALDREGAEWLCAGPDGKERHATQPVQGPGAARLAEAALAAVRVTGSSPSRCVLALGTGLVRQKVFTLPELSRRDTRAALRRKAAGLCGRDVEEVVFSATCFDETAARAGDSPAARADRRWLVAAVDRAELIELRLALARAGFKVARIVSSQISALARGQALRSDPKQACIVVSALRKSASVALIHGDTLVNENLLDGDMRTQPALAMSLVQEIKSFDAAWRKANRGGAVGQLVLIGLPRDRVPLFKAAVNAALPHAAVIAAESEGDPALDHGRVEALDACRESSGVQFDLTVPIPMQPRAVALILAALCASLGTVATIAYMPARQAELAELEAVAASNVRTAGLRELRRKNAAAGAGLMRLDELTARNAAVLARGWNVRDTATDVLQAFGTDAALIGLELGRSEKRKLEITGEAAPDPAAAMTGVARIVRALEDHERYAGVVSTPSGGLPTGAAPIAFRIRTDVAGGP